MSPSTSRRMHLPIFYPPFSTWVHGEGNYRFRKTPEWVGGGGSLPTAGPTTDHVGPDRKLGQGEPEVWRLHSSRRMPCDFVTPWWWSRTCMFYLWNGCQKGGWATPSLRGTNLITSTTPKYVSGVSGSIRSIQLLYPILILPSSPIRGKGKKIFRSPNCVKIFGEKYNFHQPNIFLSNLTIPDVQPHVFSLMDS